MKLLVFTDLDATLLDPWTYSWEAAAEALEALKSLGAGIVLVSSKTFTEMEPLYRELGLADPFIVENGGGIVFGAQSPIAAQAAALRTLHDPISQAGYSMIPLGTPYGVLVQTLQDISREVGCPLRGFASMTDNEVAALTGLEMREAVGARMRNYDEPFIVAESESRDEQIVNAARARGLLAVQGGRFWHLVGHNGKGAAVSVLLEMYRQKYPGLRTVALGDSPNDFPFLELVEFPVLVGDQNRALLPDSLTHVSRVAAGPEGWNVAILEILLQLKEVEQ
ncbi:MAG TPA: HAD-IIB family hydrolase [Desulfomonilaceae bacterium]|nr:HAD-IIB family hydrolase [Desulfomonilaceae bacterium]